MGTNYVIFYTEATIVCIIILEMLLIHGRVYNTKQEKQVWFNRAIRSFIFYFISDACWAAVLGGVLPNKRWLVEILNLSNYILMGVLSYQIMIFIMISEKVPFRKNKKIRTLLFLPLIISVVLMIALYIANPTFWISEEGELNSVYYVMMLAVPVFYLIVSIVMSINSARKVESIELKKQYWLNVFIPIGVLAAGLVQVVSLNVPTFCFCCTIMWIWFYIQNLQNLISIDALTRLNNRGEINRYMEQISYRDNAKVYAMMIDVDRFKEINDMYGHEEGDRALVLVAEALKQTCDRIKTPLFIGRYGGDEFVIIMQSQGEGETPEQVEDVLRQVLTEKHDKNQLQYALEISTGVAELTDKKDDMKACLRRADENLYQEKREKGALR